MLSDGRSSARSGRRGARGVGRGRAAAEPPPGPPGPPVWVSLISWSSRSGRAARSLSSCACVRRPAVTAASRSVLAAAVRAALRPSTVLPLSVATVASVLPASSCVRSCALVTPMYVAAASREIRRRPGRRAVVTGAALAAAEREERRVGLGETRLDRRRLGLRERAGGDLRVDLLDHRLLDRGGERCGGDAELLGGVGGDRRALCLRRGRRARGCSDRRTAAAECREPDDADRGAPAQLACGGPDDVHGRYLFRSFDLMNPSDQRRVRAAIEPGRRSHRVGGWRPRLSESTTASRS